MLYKKIIRWHDSNTDLWGGISPIRIDRFVDSGKLMMNLLLKKLIVIDD
jgi:hypothetical protein